MKPDRETYYTKWKKQELIRYLMTLEDRNRALSSGKPESRDFELYVKGDIIFGPNLDFEIRTLKLISSGVETEVSK
jgi:hypothetical protein